MSLLRILLYALLAWFLYNLVFRFIIPVYLTTKKMKKQFREMHQKMEDQAKQQQGFQQTTDKQTADKQKSTPAKQAGDYIDFEEVGD